MCRSASLVTLNFDRVDKLCSNYKYVMYSYSKMYIHFFSTSREASRVVFIPFKPPECAPDSIDDSQLITTWHKSAAAVSLLIKLGEEYKHGRNIRYAVRACSITCTPKQLVVSKYGQPALYVGMVWQQKPLELAT